MACLLSSRRNTDMRREYHVMVNGSDEGEGNGEHLFRTRVVERLGLGNYFAGYVVSSAVGYEKPCAEIFQRALRAAGDPEICYMIGDNPIADIRGGHEVGMKTVLVHTAGSCEADWSCARLAEIPAILL